MQIAILITVVLVMFIGGVIGLMLFVLKKVDPKNNDKTESPEIAEAQEFLPFVDIREDTIVLPNQQYRAIIECSSTNYHLKTAGERQAIELSFQRFLNSITFPITFFLQTKTIDNTKRLQMLDADIKATLQEFDCMKGYAEQFAKDMRSLNEQVGNSQQKKRYIIVSYDDVGTLDSLSDAEKVHYAAKEIRNRCNVVMQNLESVGVTARIINTKSLIELVYSCYYRSDFSYSECISNQEAFSLLVNGEKDNFRDLPKQNLLDIILRESINRIELGNSASEPNSEAVIKELKQLREKYAGAYSGDQ